MKRISKFFLVVLVLFSLSGCSLLNITFTRKSTANSTSEIKTTTRRITTTLTPTTVATTTVIPTTILPTTVKPTTVKPTTVVTSTMISTTVVPTTVKPTSRPTTIKPISGPNSVIPTTIKPTSGPTTIKSTSRPTTVIPTTINPTVTPTTTINVNGPFEVVYNTNGGIEIPKALLAKDSIITEVPKKEGYSFVGWFTDSDLTKLAKTVTSNMTVFAKWVEDTNEWGHTVTSGTSTFRIGEEFFLSDMLWHLSADATYLGFYQIESKGIQIGTADEPTTAISLKTKNYYETVQKVVVNASGANGTNAIISLIINGKDTGISFNLTNVAKNYEFVLTEKLEGEICIQITQTSAKAVYLKAITIYNDSSVIDEIGIKAYPSRTVFYVNEEDLNDFTVTVYKEYADGSLVELLSGYDYDMPIVIEAGRFELTVQYQEFTAKISYQVIDGSTINDVEVHFIDVGLFGGLAGEASLIQIGSIDILVDSGNNDSNSNRALLEYLQQTVTDGEIEYIIATHQDADHIGGMKTVLDNFIVTNVIKFSHQSELTILAQKFIDTIAAEHANVYEIKDLIVDDPELEIIDGISLNFLDTTYYESDDVNNASIVFVLDAYSTRILFTGDAEEKQESVYASLAGDLDIIKAGHHGAVKGTSTYLLEQTTPEVILMCNGDYLGNQYGHPTYVTLSRIYDYDNTIDIYAVAGGYGSNDTRNVDRNSDIIVNVDLTGYTISSNGDDLYEIRETTYWKNRIE